MQVADLTWCFSTHSWSASSFTYFTLCFNFNIILHGTGRITGFLSAYFSKYRYKLSTNLIRPQLIFIKSTLFICVRIIITWSYLNSFSTSLTAMSLADTSCHHLYYFHANPNWHYYKAFKSFLYGWKWSTYARTFHYWKNTWWPTLSSPQRGRRCHHPKRLPCWF